MQEHVPYYLQHQYNLYDRTKKSGIRFSCNYPEKVLSIDNQGNCFLCICDGWLPVSVGHIMSFNTIEEVWQSPVAKSLQKDIIIDKSFTHCSVDYCGIKDYNCTSDSYFISINIDESCNLQCPTCRDHFMNFTSGKIYENKLVWAKHIEKLLSNFNHKTIIAVSGNGDPFASLIYRPIIMQGKSNIWHSYKITTNGLLMKKLLRKTSIYSNIIEYSISVDAGDADTYEKIRLRGKWNVLIENLDFLHNDLKDKKNIKVNLNFCLQSGNIESLINFADLVDHYNWQGTIQPLEDWGTYKDFKQHDILNTEHELHNKMLEQLKVVSLRKNIWLKTRLGKLIKNSTDKK
tara:strand:+ start:80 stop:1117 length:1038 start_codon:yes stop_codon:yes gene_type:complete